MTHDEAVIAFLEHGIADPDVTTHLAGCASCRALVDELDDTRASLAEPFAWDEPPAGLGESIVAAIAADAADLADRADSTDARPGDADPVAPVVDLAAARDAAGHWRRIARWTTAAAVVALVVAVGSLLTLTTRQSTDIAGPPATDLFADGVTLELRGTELAPGVSGTVAMTDTPSGVRMHLDAPGLPRRDGGNFYQAWLRGPAGLVPVGTFHDADDVWLWAGVSYEDFPTFTVTEEVADGNQESSGRRVLVGMVGPSATSVPAPPTTK